MRRGGTWCLHPLRQLRRSQFVVPAQRRIQDGTPFKPFFGLSGTKVNQPPRDQPYKKICHPDRSIAIGFINRNAKWRDLLFASAETTPPVPVCPSPAERKMQKGGPLKLSFGLSGVWPHPLRSICSESPRNRVPHSSRWCLVPGHFVKDVMGLNRCSTSGYHGSRRRAAHLYRATACSFDTLLKPCAFSQLYLS